MRKYTKMWSKQNPGLMIILIDQSTSMGESYRNITKAEQTAKVINNIIESIVLKNMDGDSYSNTAYLCLIGYGDDVNILYKGGAKDFAENYIRIEKLQRSEGIGGLLDVERPIWLEPIAFGETHMAKAFKLASDIIDKWLEKYAEYATPIIFNISDGIIVNNKNEEVENIIKIFNDINNKKISRNESPWVFNFYIGGNNKHILFPENESDIDDENAKFLFQISSLVPYFMKEYLGEYLRFPVKEKSKALTTKLDSVFGLFTIMGGTLRPPFHDVVPSDDIKKQLNW